MTHFDRCRRAASIVLVVAFLVVTPGMAAAQFVSRQAAALSVSTDSMKTPTGVSGTYACGDSGHNEGVTFNVAGFSDVGQPAGSTYLYVVLRDGVAFGNPVTSGSHSQTLSVSMRDDRGSTAWGISIQAVRGNWTSQAAVTTVTCTKDSRASGSL